MFAHAMRSTNTETPSKIRSGGPAFRGTPLWPRAPASMRIGFERKRAIVCSLIPIWSDDSTSLMIARYSGSSDACAWAMVTLGFSRANT